MTHDTPPKRMVDLISREAALAIIDPGYGDFHAGNYNGIAALPTVTGYTLASEAEAMVAAALRGAADMIRGSAYVNNGEKRSLEPVRASLVGKDMHHATVADHIEALIPQPASAALDKLIAEAEARGMERAAKLVPAGYAFWAQKPHNAKWVRKIDGTPIPNDLPVCIQTAIRAAKGDQP